MDRSDSTFDGPRGGNGMALIAVMVFALIVALIGLAFFSVAAYESNGARYRQRSSEAFYLADGGIERARGEFLDDVAWRGPIPATPMGRGTYDVTVADTVLGGQDGVVVRSEGRVGNAARGVEVTGEVQSFLEEWGMVALGNVDVRGNITVAGNIHAGGDAYFGPGDVYLKSGAYDEGYPVSPPPIFTEPTVWPSDTSYYRVQYSSSPARGRIYRYDYASGLFERVYIDSLTGNQIGYKQGTSLYTVTLNGDPLRHWFDEVFIPVAPGSPVVVDFGQSDATGMSVTDLVFGYSDAAWQLRATVIDTRYEGVDEAARVAPCGGAWKGGAVTFKSKLTLAPSNCVTMIVNQLGPNSGLQNPAQVSLGTQTNPGLTYVTGNVNGVKGDLAVWGALISLCDISSQGGPTIHHVPEIEDCIPFDFQSKGSGFFHLREWREVPL